jgi:hypothetical protein
MTFPPAVVQTVDPSAPVAVAVAAPAAAPAVVEG